MWRKAATRPSSSLLWNQRVYSRLLETPASACYYASYSSKANSHATTAGATRSSRSLALTLNYTNLTTITAKYSQRNTYATKTQQPNKNLGIHMKLLQQVGKKLNIRKMDDWYNVSDTHLKAQGGGALIDNYGSLAGTLEALYPHHDWDLNKLHKHGGQKAEATATTGQILKPDNKWADINFRRQFFIDAAKKLKIKKIDDWAAVTPTELKEAGGTGLLAYYNGLLGDALQETFPQMPIDHSKFFVNQKSPAFWQDVDVQRKFFKALGDKIGVRKPEDWYQVPLQEIKDQGGAIVMSYYHNSLGKALRTIYPNHQWDLTKISDYRSRDSHKKQLSHLREWITYAERGLLIKEMEDWYRVTKNQVMKVQGSSVTVKMGGLPAILMKVYPDYPWDLSRFINLSSKMSQPWVNEVLRRLYPRGTAELALDWKHPELAYPSGEPIELEVYCSTFKMAFEFKEPPQFSNAFLIGLGREEQRIEACNKLGIKLIIIPYWWDREADSLAATIHREQPEAMPNPPVGAEPIPHYPTHAAAVQAKVLADDWLIMPSGWTGKDPKGWWMAEKVDGVRAYWDGKYLLSQHGVQIAAPRYFLDSLPRDIALDGELWLGRGEGHRMVGISTSVDDPAWETVRFCVYDAPKIEAPFEIRHDALSSMRGLSHRVMVVPVVQCTGQSHLDSYFEEVRQLGGDGVLMWRANSDYEHGKSSNLVKFKVPQETEVRFVKKNERTCALICEQADGQRVNVRISAQMYNYDFVPSTVMTVGYDGLWESGQLRSPAFVRERDDLIWDNIVATKKDSKMRLAGASDEEEEEDNNAATTEGGQSDGAVAEGGSDAPLAGEREVQQSQVQQNSEEQVGDVTTTSDGTVAAQPEIGEGTQTTAPTTTATTTATTPPPVEDSNTPLSPKMKRMLRMQRAKQLQEEEGASEGTGSSTSGGK